MTTNLVNNPSYNFRRYNKLTITGWDSKYTNHILNKLWSMTSYGFDSLKYVHFTMLNHLLDASIRRTIYSTSTSPIP